MEHKVGSCDRVDFEAIVRKDAIARIQNLSEAIELTLVVAGDRVAHINQASPPLGKLFKALVKDGPNTSKISVSWQFDGRTHDPDRRKLTKLKEGVVDVMNQVGADHFERGILRGRSEPRGPIEQIDLVAEAMSESVDVAEHPDNSTIVDSESVWAEIERSHREHLRPHFEESSAS